MRWEMMFEEDGVERVKAELTNLVTNARETFHFKGELVALQTKYLPPEYRFFTIFFFEKIEREKERREIGGKRKEKIRFYWLV